VEGEKVIVFGKIWLYNKIYASRGGTMEGEEGWDVRLRAVIEHAHNTM
jgi:hypothetical protein